MHAFPHRISAALRAVTPTSAPIVPLVAMVTRFKLV
jgi:hypothetical protein